ncbi:MAG: hypothetical protein GY792_24380 [Gammaproteobacteria bacterium]|nr:hypothetical protein [Gammaproteobacteria bacterium]
MIEKSESNQLSLATAPILGPAPRENSARCHYQCAIVSQPVLDVVSEDRI